MFFKDLKKTQGNTGKFLVTQGSFFDSKSSNHVIVLNNHGKPRMLKFYQNYVGLCLPKKNLHSKSLFFKIDYSISFYKYVIKIIELSKI